MFFDPFGVEIESLRTLHACLNSWRLLSGTLLIAGWRTQLRDWSGGLCRYAMTLIPSATRGSNIPPLVAAMHRGMRTLGVWNPIRVQSMVL